jgi:SET domain-containing protein
MAPLENYLVVKRSGTKGAGTGLLTRKFIKKGTRIVEYKGTKTTWRDVKRQAGFNGYVYYINRDLVIDATDHLNTFGRFANDAKDVSKEKTLKNNRSYVIEKEKVFIKAIKDIPADSEILVSYGKEYWDVVRYNGKLSL